MITARPNLMKLLHRDIERGAAWARERGLNYLMNAHRLDFETSGVILLAKSKPALDRAGQPIRLRKAGQDFRRPGSRLR